MYRYSVDQAITYTSEDLVLFKESPFACWMERLTLENPDHGIPANTGTSTPRDTMEPQDDLADTLRAESKDVVLVDWEMEEPLRRTATLEAMRHGADFIVNGQLALGSLSGSANLLMRTSGYSDLGSFLYVPCNTQKITNLHSALRLCFLADLLNSLQGQLPPQMLIIRGGSNVVPLETEDHIYHYRAVKHRFMAAQQAFRKHKMPDPAQSSHFGRWEDCANEVLKQRALRAEHSDDVEDVELPQIFEQLQTAGGGTAYDLDAVNQHAPVSAGSNPGGGPEKGHGTLAEQARNLSPMAFSPAPSAGQQIDTLQNLAFIGSSNEAPTIGQGNSASAAPSRPAPKANLRQPNLNDTPPVYADPRASDIPELVSSPTVSSRTAPGRDLSYLIEPRIETLSEPEPEPEPVMRKSHPLDSPGFQSPRHSMVDLDVSTAIQKHREAPPQPLADTADVTAPESTHVEPGRPLEGDQFLGRPRANRFSSSLITGASSGEEDS